jgi:hypothetical protein
LVSAAGRASLDFPQGWPGPATLRYVDEQGIERSENWDALDPWLPLVEVFEQAIADAAANRRRPVPGRTAPETLTRPGTRLGWQDEVRGLELDDAARRSALRHRSSALELVEATEEASFKGTMTILGCGLIWLGLVLLILSAWVHWLAWAIVPIFAVFLLLQAFRWVVPAAPEQVTPERSALPKRADRGEFEERRGRDAGS